MHQNMQTLYFPDLKWSKEERDRVRASSKVPLKEFSDVRFDCNSLQCMIVADHTDAVS